MPIEKQFSIFAQNKAGALSKLCEIFAESDLNIKTISITDDLEWGIIRVIADNAERAKVQLDRLGFMYGESQVLIVELRNHPGALKSVADKLAGNGINIERAFSTAVGDKSLLVLSTTDDIKAQDILAVV